MRKDELWIGLVNVTPMDGNTDIPASKGAYVNVIIFALNANDYCEKVKTQLSEKNYYAIEFEDVELFNERANNYQLNDELLELASWVKRTGKIGLDTFHTYDMDETLM